MEARKLKVVTVAVKDLDQALKTFQGNFGFPVTRRAIDASSATESAYLAIGEAEIELVAGNATADVAGFIAERGEGLFCLDLEVSDLAAALRDLEARGVETRSEVLCTGQSVIWAGPRGTNGALLRLIESPPEKG